VLNTSKKNNKALECTIMPFRNLPGAYMENHSGS